MQVYRSGGKLKGKDKKFLLQKLTKNFFTVFINNTMQIRSINNLNFKASFIDNGKVLKKDTTGNYQPCDVNFIEFKLNDKNDVTKIHDICSMPEFSSLGKHLIEIIYAATLPSRNDYYNTHCYALVKENEENFDDINTNNVLGIFTVYEGYPDKNTNHIPYFMTNSKYSNNKEIKPNEEYSGIGTGMINAFKNQHPNDSICLYPSTDAINFWGKNDFRYNNSFRMTYNP